MTEKAQGAGAAIRMLFTVAHGSRLLAEGQEVNDLNEYDRADMLKNGLAVEVDSEAEAAAKAEAEAAAKAAAGKAKG
jgi:hypothetical protein